MNVMEKPSIPNRSGYIVSIFYSYFIYIEKTNNFLIVWIVKNVIVEMLTRYRK